MSHRLEESELEECRAPLRLAVGLGDPYLGEHWANELGEHWATGLGEYWANELGEHSATGLGEHSAHRLDELVLEDCLRC